MKVVTRTDIDAYRLLARGKVRDIYEIDGQTLLIVTTDRMSAFDVVMDSPIPYKGVILNQITLFWMNRFKEIIPNHLVESDAGNFPSKLNPWRDELAGRAVLARKATPLPIECIVRGYVAGSGWKDYLSTGQIGGHHLPPGLKEAAKLDPPVFTPSTKAALGQHDENITENTAEKLLGKDVARLVEKTSLKLYASARDYAARRGIIVADTKFEFGFVDGELRLIDEVLTPDSSRFWPTARYAPGKAQPSFDKQYLRDWLEKQPWNKQPPPPRLPADIIEATTQKYHEAFELLTGKPFEIS